MLLVLGATLLVVELVAGGFDDTGANIRNAAFQAVAVMTTTGFATADFSTWGPLAATTIVLLMFVGASAGSTGGSIKVIRHLLLFRIVKRELTQTVHRERVAPITVSGAVVDERALRSAVVFVLLYLLTFVIGALALSLDAAPRGHRPAGLRRLRGRRGVPGQRRAGLRLRRAVRLLRAVQRRLDRRPVGAHVARAPGDRARRGAAQPGLLAGVIGRGDRVCGGRGALAERAQPARADAALGAPQADHGDGRGRRRGRRAETPHSAGSSSPRETA